MSCTQITACWRSINVTNSSPSRCLPSLPYISLTYATCVPRTSLRQATNASAYKRCTPVCLFGGKGNSENENEETRAGGEKGKIKVKIKRKRKQHLIKKEIEPIISKDDLKNGPTTDATCPSCNYGKAAFQQLQTRSADEPMTTFYRCLNESCGRQWRED